MSLEKAKEPENTTNYDNGERQESGLDVLPLDDLSEDFSFNDINAFDSVFVPKSPDPVGDKTSSESQEPPKSLNSEVHAPSEQQTIGKKRRNHGEGDSAEEASDDKDNQRQVEKKRLETKLKYACPYLKYSPRIFSQRRVCCGPGWSELHRLKEHLLRSHQLPGFYCPRCGEKYLKEGLLVEHLKQPTACTLRQPMQRDLVDGFDDEQRELLRKTRTGKGSEKWIRWYCILFKLDSTSPYLPSPFVDGKYDLDEWQISGFGFGFGLHSSRCAFLEKTSATVETEWEKNVS